MKTVNTLTGIHLNRAVAMSLGLEVVSEPDSRGEPIWYVRRDGHTYRLPDYVGEIKDAWPIIEAQDIDIFNTHTVLGFKATLNLKPQQEHWFSVGYGTTRLEAAMRAVVQSVYGDTINLPSN